MDMTVHAEVQAAEQTVNGLQSEGNISLPLSSLYVAKANVRKKEGKMPIPDLAAAIKREGLLQNLVVFERKGKRKAHTHGVVAGQRRYQALMLLAEAGDISADWMVPCKLIAAENAASASLIENIAREGMHPADELDAFAKLLKEGHSFESIGNTFGVSAMTVRRRIKLLSVSPKLLKLLRTDEISLEQLAALSVNDSHEIQETVWAECQRNDWAKQPDRLRSRLTQDEVNAKKDPIAKFVGLEAYEAAGGVVRRDLFSTEDTGYIADSALLYRLADEKLNAEAETLRLHGWSWVETRHSQDYSLTSRMGRLSAAIVIPDDLKPQIEELGRQITSLSEEIAAFYDSEDESEEANQRNDEREERCSELESQKEQLEKACMQWTSEQRQVAGVVLYIDHSGLLRTEYGLVRRTDRPVDSEGQAMPMKDQYGMEMQPKVKARAAHSDKMVARLTAHRTIAVQAELMRKPAIALAFLTERLAAGIFHLYAPEAALQVRSSSVHYHLTNAADDMEQSSDWQAVASEKDMWTTKLPEKQGDLLPWLLQQPQEVVLELMAFCVARSIDGIRQREDRPAPMDAVAAALGVEMADHWNATEASYFGHISKNQMIAAVTEAVSAEAAAPLAGLKKDAAAKAAERTMQGVRWVPEPMRPREASQATVDEADDLDVGEEQAEE